MEVTDNTTFSLSIGVIVILVGVVAQWVAMRHALATMARDMQREHKDRCDAEKRATDEAERMRGRVERLERWKERMIGAGFGQRSDGRHDTGPIDLGDSYHGR